MRTGAAKEMDQALTVGGLLRDAAADYGKKPCIKYRMNGETVTKSYRELYADSLECAAYILQLCPEKSHIALIGKTSYRYLVCLNAIILSGNTAVPIANNLPLRETVKLLGDSDAVGILYDGTLQNADAVLAASPMIRFRMLTEVAPPEPPDAPLEAPMDTPDGCAVILYSSGTTGERKGVMLSSYALASNVCFKEMSFEGDHVALNVLPMYHIFSFSCDYLKNLKDGVCICLNSSLPALGEELLLFEPSVLRLVPTVADSLLRRVRILRKRNPDMPPREAAERVFGRNLRNIIVSGAAYSAANDREFSEMGITVRQGYGMTETGPRIAVPDGNTCAASGGRIISICQVRLQNGEIQVKSPSLMTGYYKREEETRAMFTEDGWLRTGDLGRITPDRELFITGRLKNVIILGNGENVSPEEIEAAYLTEPLVAEIEVYEDGGKIAAEILPDEAYVRTVGITNVGAAVEALVEKKNKENIAAKEIDRVTVRTTPFPKTETGKIKRRRWNT